MAYATTTQLNNEVTARKAADSALSAKLTVLEATVATLEDAVAALIQSATPPPPSGARAVYPTDNIPALIASGITSFALHAGTYHFGFGATERHDTVSLDAYGDGPVIIDGTGLDPHFLYLGSGAHWSLGAIGLKGFVPPNSGVVAIGDGCSIATLPGFSLVGAGVKGDTTSHGIYFHGTGTGVLNDPYISGVPGAALQTYRGTPKVTVNKGRLGGMYESVLAYSGEITFAGTAFISTAAAWDIQNGGAAVNGLATCTGTGPNGAVRSV